MAEILPQHQAFIDAYLLSFNATEAAIVAGYSKKTARSQGSRLLTNADIRAAIDRTVQNKSERCQLSQDWVLERLKEQVQRCMQREAVLGEDGEPIGVWRYEPNAANRALELIGKHLMMFDGEQYDASDLSKLSDDQLAARRRRFKLLP